MYVMITKLNSVLRGWAEHYRTCTATRIFSKIGWIVWCYLWRLLKQRHRRIPRRKLREKYFTKIEGNNWVFKCLDSRRQEMLLFQIGWVDIKRHLLCKNRKLNPYDKNNWEYYSNRVRLGARKSVLVTKKRKKLLTAQNGICPICEQPLLNGEILEVHHRKPRSRGGDDRLRNLVMLHQTCHKQVTHSKNLNQIALWKHMEIIID
jgi:RNA-directed DNA polymerase